MLKWLFFVEKEGCFKVKSFALKRASFKYKVLFAILCWWCYTITLLCPQHLGFGGIRTAHICFFFLHGNSSTLFLNPYKYDKVSYYIRFLTKLVDTHSYNHQFFFRKRWKIQFRFSESSKLEVHEPDVYFWQILTMVFTSDGHI